MPASISSASAAPATGGSRRAASKILLFGREGQLGQELMRSLLSQGEVLGLARAEADLSRPESLPALLARYRPAIIVNAAAYTAVDKAEKEEALAMRINAESVAMMAAYAAAQRALLVHYSTDYVFDGEKTEPYREADITAPLNVYGRSKWAGEQAIAQSGCAALVFRTSWLYSVHSDNFVKTMLHLARERLELKVVSDQLGVPTSAEWVADVSALALYAWREGRLDPGLYHLVAGGATSWHGLASHAVAHAQQHHQHRQALRVHAIVPITSAEYPLPARRPRHTLLDPSLLVDRLGLYLPSWRVHLERVVDQLLLRQPLI